MGIILWKNLSAIPEPERSALATEYDELGHRITGQPRTDVIFVSLRRGDVVEVRPATCVRLSGDTLQVLNDKYVVAKYPRERVVLAPHEPIEPPPFC